MSVSMIDAWRRPGCGTKCIPRRCDVDTHEAYGMALVLMTQRVPPVRIVRTGGLIIDLEAARVTVDGELIRLSGREWAVLAYLAVRAGRFVSNDSIITAVWGESTLMLRHRDGTRGDLANVNVAINRLRMKLGGAARLIASVTLNGNCGRRLEVEP